MIFSDLAALAPLREIFRVSVAALSRLVYSMRTFLEKSYFAE